MFYGLIPELNANSFTSIYIGLSSSCIRHSLHFTQIVYTHRKLSLYKFLFVFSVILFKYLFSSLWVTPYVLKKDSTLILS